MRNVEMAASLAIALAKKRDLEEVTPDELLLGCLQAVSQFGIAQLGSLTLDVEELGIDWLRPPQTNAKVAYSREVVTLFDHAVLIAGANGSGPVQIEHLLAAFATQDSGLMGELKRRHGITSTSWRAAVAQFALARSTQLETTNERSAHSPPVRDYLSPEEAADALGIHVQTVRAYVRSGKLPALRLAGERAIRIRRKDLETVLEPLTPQP